MSNKWETAPKSIKDVYSALSDLYDMFNIEPELLDKVLDDYKELEAKHQKALEAISRCEDEIDDKDKLIGKLHKKIDSLWSVNEELNRKIKDLEKENKDLKDTLEKDKEFGKKIGKYVAECIQEGGDMGLYEWHPDTRIDIHVEETKYIQAISFNMPTIFDRHAISRIAIRFNNTQTEMERDTAQHECEELNEKIKELEKENKDLKQTLAMCERDANTARKLCDGIAFHAEHARNKTPWFTNF